jgi:hypothetical protein
MTDTDDQGAGTENVAEVLHMIQSPVTWGGDGQSTPKFDSQSKSNRRNNGSDGKG